MRAWLDDQGEQPERPAPRVHRRGHWLDDDEPAASPTLPDGAPSPAPRGRFELADDTLLPFDHDKATEPAAESDDAAARLGLDDGDAANHGWAVGLCVAGGFAVATMLASGIATGDSELVAATFIAAALATLSISIFKRLAKADGAPELTVILSASLSLKLLGTLARFYVGTSVYDRSDASEYDLYGRKWAADYLSQGTLPNVNKWTSTNFVRIVTAEFYHYTTPTKIGGFVFFSWIGLMGLLLFARGFRRVFPEAQRRYLLLVMFAPSLMYWPSSIGKEALAIFGLGLATYGVALMLTNATIIGAVCIAGGIIEVTYVRTHVAMVVTVAMTIALLLRKRKGVKASGTVATFFLLITLGSFVLTQANDYFGTNLLDGTSAVTDEFDAAQDRTEQGGSQFTPAPAWNFPMRAITVLFRPLPVEATSPQELVTSVESFAYAIALAIAGRRLLKSIRRDYAYAIFAIVAVVFFVIVFGNFANFGILARQRTQILPFLFILLSMPERPKPVKYTSIMQRRFELDPESV